MKATFVVSAAALFASAGLASAQLSPIGPFTGLYTESFETQTPFVFTQCLQGRIFNNTADLCDSTGTGAHVTTGWSFMCSIFPHTGGHFTGSAGGPYMLTFDAPVARFGGYFGTNSGTDGAVLTFYDSSQAVIGTQNATTAGCTWTWNGWQSSVPIKAILITGNNAFGGGFTDMDDLEYDFTGGGPTGACCRNNGTCLVTNSSGCSSLGGVYRGDNTDCATANCPAGGACCMALGACSTLTSAACTAANGTYRGDGTSCATAACPGGFTMDCSRPGTFTDISATGAAIVDGDDNVGAFTSSVTNALVTNPNLNACTNGFISDSATYNAFTNAALPVSTPGLTFGLFPNWDDLYVDPATTPPGTLVHQGVVEGGVNVEVIQWNQVRTFGGTAQGTFEVKIFASGPIMAQYLYQSMAWDANGASSTVGVQWGANLAYQNSFNQAGSIPDNAVCSIIQTGAPSECYANCDESTQQPCLNVLDFSCFLNQFAAGNSYANCDNSTQPPVLNVLDFSCFLNRFAAGCSSC